MNRLFATSSLRFLTFARYQKNLKLKSFLLSHETAAFTKRNCSRSISIPNPVINQNDFKEDVFKDELEHPENESSADRLSRIVKEINVKHTPKLSRDEIEDNENEVIIDKPFDGEIESNESAVLDETSAENEPITSRLRRLSMSSYEEFVPSPMAKAAREKLKSRYSKLEESYTARYPHRSNQGFRERGGGFSDRGGGFNDRGGYNKDRFGGGGGYRGGFDDDGSNYRRYFSTKATQSSGENFVDEADVFGTIAKNSSKPTNAIVDEALSKEVSLFDEEEDDVRFRPDNGWTQRKLRFKIKELARDHKIKEAIDTLTTAHKEGGFQFNKYDMGYLYSIVISVCAKVGYVRMCFKLFTDMKKRQLKPSPGIYTSLFNACANSPWDAEENLKRISRLRINMSEKNIKPNLLNCNAMIKAYGRCGDIQSAFAVVDEIKDTERPTTETFNFLLQACISDKENGYRHMIFTWGKMKSLRIRPDIYTYNLLLRSVRECSIQYFGHRQTSDAKSNKEKTSDDIPLALASHEADKMVDLIVNNNRGNFGSESSLSLLSDGDILKALNVSPKNRLAIFGGLHGFLSSMKQENVYPDIKTMMEFVQIVNPEEFADLMHLLRRFKIKPDISLFNLMIKRYQFCYQQENALAVLKDIGNFHLSPNIMTWGVLSLGCQSWLTAASLLGEMNDANFLPNLIIMETLLSNAVNSYDSVYVVNLMKEMQLREMKPDTKFVIKLQKFRDEVQTAIINKERGKTITPTRLANVMEGNLDFERDFGQFKMRYVTWLKQTEVIIEPRDPWEADYRERYPPKRRQYANETDEELMAHYDR